MLTSPQPFTYAQRLRRFAYLVGQHPLRLHRGLVTRGLRVDWLAEFNAYFNEPGLPLDNAAGFHALRYAYAHQYQQLLRSGAIDETMYTTQSARCMLFSFIWRRELHPLRWWPWAWALRRCTTILEYGAGAAPFAHGMTRAWPGSRLPSIALVDIKWVLRDYCAWRFAHEPWVALTDHLTGSLEGFDGILCTETFEHLPEPLRTARRFTKHATVVVFDYVEDGGEAAGRYQRKDVLRHFELSGQLTGPDQRGTYVWRHA